MVRMKFRVRAESRDRVGLRVRVLRKQGRIHDNISRVGRGSKVNYTFFIL